MKPTIQVAIDNQQPRLLFFVDATDAVTDKAAFESFSLQPKGVSTSVLFALPLNPQASDRLHKAFLHAKMKRSPEAAYSTIQEAISSILTKAKDLDNAITTALTLIKDTAREDLPKYFPSFTFSATYTGLPSRFAVGDTNYTFHWASN